jgi:hypothetical protein
MFFMAKFEADVLGKFRGKVGSVVGSRWNGINYVKHKGPSTRSNNSPKQKEQQAKFLIVAKFARQLSKLLNITYKTRAHKMTAKNNAIGYILQNAITGTYPNYEIEYSKVLISRGGLEPAMNPTVSVAAGTMTWRWVNNTDMIGAENSDLSIVVIYCPETKQCRYRLYGTTRASQAATLDVTPFVGKAVVTYLAFIAEGRDAVSDSVFTGEFLVV